MSDPRIRLSAALAGRYELDRELGHGGMATVWLARDLRHGRQVALKVLRPELGAVIGADRFLAEIRTTAHLQHPHILPLFDSGEADGLLFYVMPLIEGESLRDRLDRETQLPVDVAVRLASEVASALDYAHRHGVIHRDIKPENVLLHDGRALVADFGIALAASRAGGSRMTETGMSLGTPHYMSPEQAMGERELDARSDVYSLGAMAYEMLAGEPPYTGATAQAIVAKVITEKPAPLTTRRDTVPPHVAAAIHRALTKLPADRFPTAAAFAEALNRPGTVDVTAYTTAATPAVPPRPRWFLPGMAAAIALLALAAGALLGRRTAPEPAAQVPSRLSIIGEGVGAAGASRLLAISPDGEAVAYNGSSSQGIGQLFLYRLESGEAQALPGTSAGIDLRFGRDSRELWFVGQSGTLRLGLAAGGVPEPRPGITLSPFAAWAPDGGLWITDPGNGSLGRVPPGGGSVEARFPRDSTGTPQVQAILPGGRHALVVTVPLSAISGPLQALDLQSGRRTTLIESAITEARYTSGLLVVVRADGTLEAMPFDPEALRITGPSAVIGTNVAIAGSIAQVAVSDNGTLAWVPSQPRELVLVDRGGTALPLRPERRIWHNPRFSPDGRRIAVDFPGDDGRDVYVLDRAQGTLTRATFVRDGHDAEWTPDGRALSFLTFASGPAKVALARPGSTAAPESLFAMPASQLIWSGTWLPDGSGVVTVTASATGQSGFDLSILRRPDWRPEPLVLTPYGEAWPSISPDGRWMAFSANLSGRQEIYVTSLAGHAVNVQVSLDGGTEPVWSRTGREIFYRRPRNATEAELVAAAVEVEPDFRVTGRTTLFPVDLMEGSQPHSNWDAAPDGQSFVFVRRSATSRIEVIQNLPELVRRLQRSGSAAR